MIIFSLNWVRGSTKAFVQQKEIAYQSSVDVLKTSVSEGKSLIAAAVTDKGVSTAADATFQTIASNIRKIGTSTEFNVDYFTTGDSGGWFTKNLANDNDGNFIIAQGKYGRNISIDGSRYESVENDRGGIIIRFNDIQYLIYASRTAYDFMQVIASEYALNYVYLSGNNKVLNYQIDIGRLFDTSTNYTIWYW